MTLSGGGVFSCALSTGPQSNRCRRRGLNITTSLHCITPSIVCANRVIFSLHRVEAVPVCAELAEGFGR